MFIKISLKFRPKNPIDNDAPDRRQAIIWTNADSIQWRIYAALGVGGELTLIELQSGYSGETNTMAIDGLSPCVAGPSAIMILIM